MKIKVLITALIIISILISGCLESPSGPSKKTIVIGSKLFQESYILAHMISLLLEDHGYKTNVKEGLGSTFINYEALKQGQIDTYVEYTGTAYSEILKLPPLKVWDPEVVYTDVEKGLHERDNVTVVEKLGFENAYAIAVKDDWARSHNVSKISDLKDYASNMTIGTDPEFATRADGLPHIKNVYGFTFKSYKAAVATIMYEAIKNNQVDAISAYTTDTRDNLFNLRILEDDKHALPPYDAIIIVTDKFAAENPGAIDILKELNGRINSTTMRNLNYQYDVEKKDARDIAKGYLIEQGLIKK